MSHPIKAADTGSVPSPDHNYRCLRTELAEQLVSIFRIMFPHDTLPDEFTNMSFGSLTRRWHRMLT